MRERELGRVLAHHARGEGTEISRAEAAFDDPGARGRAADPPILPRRRARGAVEGSKATEPGAEAGA